MENAEISKLKKVNWVITDACNQKCKYCFGQSAFGKPLSYDEHLTILNNLLEFGVNKITWSGGECLLIPHLMVLLKHSNDAGVFNKINTNGLLLSHQNLNELSKVLKQINITVDSLNPQTNKVLGKPIGHEEIVLNAINDVKSRNMNIAVNTVVTKQNINDIDELGKALVDKKIYEWKLMQYTNFRGRAKENTKQFSISDDQFQDVFNKMSEKYPSVLTRTVTKKEFEEKNLLIVPDGSFQITRDGQDIYLDNSLNGKVNLDKMYFDKKY